MIRRAALAALLCVLALNAPAVAQDARTSLPDIEDEVMCVECGTALNLSQAPVAEQMRRFIRQQIAAGRSKQEIKDALADQFGPAVLALPERKGFNLAAYVVPPLAGLLALAGIVLAARRWRRAGSSPIAAPTQDLQQADQQRLERDMAGYDL